MSSEVPDLAALRRAATLYDGPTFDQSWLRLVENTKPGMDLSRAEHRALLLPWLNSWGCRIRYPREGEPAPFDTGMSDWWSTWHAALPAVSLAQLSDDDIDLLAEAYAGAGGGQGVRWARCGGRCARRPRPRPCSRCGPTP